jgi:hypothetical protein
MATPVVIVGHGLFSYIPIFTQASAMTIPRLSKPVESAKRGTLWHSFAKSGEKLAGHWKLGFDNLPWESVALKFAETIVLGLLGEINPIAYRIMYCCRFIVGILGSKFAPAMFAADMFAQIGNRYPRHSTAGRTRLVEIGRCGHSTSTRFTSSFVAWIISLTAEISKISVPARWQSRKRLPMPI